MPEDTDTVVYTTQSTETPSLDILGSEPVPSEIVRDLLSTEWNSSNVDRPQIHVLNDTDFPNMQGNLRRDDFVVIELDSINESQRGFTYEFKDIEIPVMIQIHTVGSRQRLYNLMAEIRRIIYKNHISTRPYQMIYWDNFEEDSDGKNKYWLGFCHIRLTSEGVPIFKGVVTGMGSENLPEAQR